MQRDDVRIDKRDFYFDFYSTVMGDVFKHIPKFIGINAADAKDLSPEDLENMKLLRKTYITLPVACNLPSILKYPGFLFSDEASAKEYYNSYFHKISEVPTTPRGYAQSGIAIVGYKPGTIGGEKFYFPEASWMLGPSSKILSHACIELGIYPYFSNVYKDKMMEPNFNVTDTIEELKTLRKINKKLKVLFLGSYEEYEKVMDGLSGTDIECKKVWHPAYILRMGNSLEMYTEWKNSIKLYLEGKHG
jgi:hypothetical protein